VVTATHDGDTTTHATAAIHPADPTGTVSTISRPGPGGPSVERRHHRPCGTATDPDDWHSTLDSDTLDPGAYPGGWSGTGQRTSAELHVLGARVYDPATCRFLAPDTVLPGAANPLAHNRYAYVFNSYWNLIDPSGHVPAPPPGPDDDGEESEDLAIEEEEDDPVPEPPPAGAPEDDLMAMLADWILENIFPSVVWDGAQEHRKGCSATTMACFNSTFDPSGNWGRAYGAATRRRAFAAEWNAQVQLRRLEREAYQDLGGGRAAFGRRVANALFDRRRPSILGGGGPPGFDLRSLFGVFSGGRRTFDSGNNVYSWQSPDTYENRIVARIDGEGSVDVALALHTAAANDSSALAIRDVGQLLDGAIAHFGANNITGFNVSTHPVHAFNVNRTWGAEYVAMRQQTAEMGMPGVLMRRDFHSSNPVVRAFSDRGFTDIFFRSGTFRSQQLGVPVRGYHISIEQPMPDVHPSDFLDDFPDDE
jgi:RHS repeat-associated protein